jgi:hypothetical protein
MCIFLWPVNLNAQPTNAVWKAMFHGEHTLELSDQTTKMLEKHTSSGEFSFNPEISSGLSPYIKSGKGIVIDERTFDDLRAPGVECSYKGNTSFSFDVSYNRSDDGKHITFDLSGRVPEHYHVPGTPIGCEPMHVLPGSDACLISMESLKPSKMELKNETTYEYTKTSPPILAPPYVTKDTKHCKITIFGGLPPVANAGLDQKVNADAIVTLDGSASYDPQGNPITYAWSQIAGKPTVLLNSPTSKKSTFRIPHDQNDNVEGTLIFQLTVNNGRFTSTPDTVNVDFQFCPKIGETIPVTLPPVSTKTDPRFLKSYQLIFGKLNLLFTSQGPNKPMKILCALKSNVGSLPVMIRWLHLRGTEGYVWATSTTPATLSYYKAKDILAKPCIWTRNGISNNCFLNSLPTSPNSIVVKWQSPGFSIKMLRFPTYTTGPLTYFMNVGSLKFVTQMSVIFVEFTTHTTLIKHLSQVDNIAVIQDPPGNDLLVTNQIGLRTGILPNGKQVVEIPGSTYIALGNVTAVLIFNASDGKYKVQVTGKLSGPFELSSSITGVSDNFSKMIIREAMVNSTIEKHKSKIYEASFNRHQAQLR